MSIVSIYAVFATAEEAERIGRTVVEDESGRLAANEKLRHAYLGF